VDSPHRKPSQPGACAARADPFKLLLCYTGAAMEQYTEQKVLGRGSFGEVRVSLGLAPGCLLSKP
jgi:hypothetical protein